MHRRGIRRVEKKERKRCVRREARGRGDTNLKGNFEQRE
jgi:hypothetical protein